MEGFRGRRRLLAVVAAAAAIMVTPALARKQQVRITGNGSAIVIQATINDRVNGRFLLDTGATYCVISKKIAEDAFMRGRTAGRKIRLRTVGGSMEATLGQARWIEVGDAVARDVPVAVTEDDPVPGLQGLIGLSFLRNFKYSVDSARGLLLLED